MKRLSKSIDDIKPHYGAVVIGSGYGGAIAASRLARAGVSVCLLERGKEFMPGEFPDTELEGVREIQLDTPNEHIGSQTGLFNFHLNDDISVLTGCGLGGTSLINANVSIKPEDRVFVDSRWPVNLQADVPTLLEEGFTRAKNMLKANPYPDHLPELPKLKALEQVAQTMDREFYKLDINVTFEDLPNGVNHVGVPQKACNLCGDCVSGCNHLAKNTTQMNYLPDAYNFGAEIFTEVPVSFIEKVDGRYKVHFQVLHQGREHFNQDTLFVCADIVVLAAGSLGSSEILLRSKQRGLAMSDQIGHHFTGNGDVLGFAYNTDHVINGVGFGTHDPADMAPVGPCITSVIDLRYQTDLENGFVIEEGSLPAPLAGVLPAMFSATAKMVGEETHHSFLDNVKEKGRILESYIRGARAGAVRNTQTYLVMSHDSSKGAMNLNDKGRLFIDWKGVGSEPIFETVNSTLRETAAALGGTYVKNPLWTKFFNKELITVHPLGGCCMGETAETGVVNHKGQVFSGTEGGDVHEGLYVCDGSIIPRSLGVNPLLTISALTERNMHYLAEDRGLKIDYDAPSLPPQPKEPEVQHAGIMFTETMKGFFSTLAHDDYQTGFDLGKQNQSAFEFTLTIRSNNLDEMLTDSNHAAGIVGTVVAPVLSAEPLTVNAGIFNLFVQDADLVETRRMIYRLPLTSVEGKEYYMVGYKLVHNDPKADMWADTTTLFITVYDGKNDQAPVLGKGILHIQPADFMKQMTTMRVLNEPSKVEQLKALARFGQFFAGALYDTYGGVIAKQHYFNPDAPPRKKRPLRTETPEVHFYHTSDNLRLRLIRYNGGNKGPILLSHGFSASSVTFSLDTIETNLTEYLYAHGYDVWLVDYRLSVEMPYTGGQWTVDDVATKDYPAAVDTVRAITGADKIDILAHCVGALGAAMAVLNGMEGVRSMILFQVSTHIQPPLLNKIKTGLYLPSVMESLGIKSLTSYTDTHSDWKDRLFDQMLRLYPMDEHEHCQNPVCHRLTFMFGRIIQHDQLNQLTHDTLHEQLGEANITTFEHLAMMFREHKLLLADGSDHYMPHLDRMKMPITLISGAKNGVFLPESSEGSYNELCAANGSEYYTRHVLDGYGHNDCLIGKNTAHDVYPLVLEHLEKVEAAQKLEAIGR
jgi:cholesterol oxidase